MILYRICAAVVVLLAFWMYYPALSLPHSLIDDAVFLKNTERWTSDFQNHGWEYALKHDVGVKQQVFNVAFMLASVFNYTVSGMQPFHYVRLILLAVACLLIMLLCRQLLPRRVASRYFALAAVVIFFSSEVPGGLHLQSLRASWFRLFCSDVEGICFLGGQALAVLMIYKNLQQGRSTWHLVVAAILCGFVAFAYKVPFVAMATGPVFAAMALSYMCGRRAMGHRLLAVFSAVVVLFLTFISYMRSISDIVDAHAYGSDVVDSLEGIRKGWNFYKDSHWQVQGPMMIAGAMGLIMVVPHFWRRRRANGFLPLLGLAYFAVFAAAAFGIYVVWSHLLLRYMLSCHYALCILLALICGYGWPRLRLLWRKRKVALLWVPVGMAISFIAPVISAPLLLLTAVIAAWRRWTFPGGVVAGLLLVGFCYQLVVLPVIRTATNTYYVRREHVNWKMTMDVMRLSVMEKNICFVGNAADEYIGSMIGHIMRMGVPPRIFPSSDADNCTSSSYLLVHRWLSPPELQAQIKGRPTAALYDLGTARYKMHISFWEWRNKVLGGGTDKLPYKMGSEPFVWLLYGPVLPEG